MPSTQIDYQVRPNKVVERKMIFGALVRLVGHFATEQYSYIGLGAYWFTDLVMAHKRLGIRDLVSIEGDRKTAIRARANRPYSYVEVKEGLSTLLLPEVLKQRSQVIVWLDYDGGVSDIVLDDIQILGERLQSGSIACVTVNANSGQFGGEDVREVQLRKSFPEVAEPLPDGFFQKPPNRFPMQLAGLLLGRLTRIVAERIGERFLPLFNFFYQDGAPMITVGGIVINSSQIEDVRKTGIFDEAGITGETQFVIDAPALTRREKLAFDRLIPESSDACTPGNLEGAGLPGLVASEDAAYYDSLLRRYAPVYKQYPTFSEVEL